VNLSIGLYAPLQQVLVPLLGVFSRPSRVRFLVIATGWLLSTGRRTITTMIRMGTLGHSDHWDGYYRFLSQGAWKDSALFQAWATLLVPLVCPRGPLTCGGDDTLMKHRGAKIFGIGPYRDGCRSSHRRVVLSFGHNWVVLFLLVKRPLWPGRWIAFPVNFRLRVKGRRQTAVDLMREMIEELAAWFPQRKLLLCADGGYSSLARKLPARCTLIARLRGDAAIYQVPPRRRTGRRGPWPSKGPKMPHPRDIAKDPRTRWKTLRVRLYGERRKLQVHSYVGVWAEVTKSPIRIILSRNPDTLDVEYFFITDPERSVKWAIETYGGRYSLERTFQDVKQHLGVEDPQVRRPRSVERAVPIGMMLYGVVVHWYAAQGHRVLAPRKDRWYRSKPHASFQDMLAAARVLSWQQSISGLSTVSPETRELLAPLCAALAKVA
jgi:hypothetical protein